MIILIGTECEIDAMPADLVQKADLILTHNPEEPDGFFWECTKDRRGTVGKGSVYPTAASALAWLGADLDRT